MLACLSSASVGSSSCLLPDVEQPDKTRANAKALTPTLSRRERGKSDRRVTVPPPLRQPASWPVESYRPRWHPCHTNAPSPVATCPDKVAGARAVAAFQPQPVFAASIHHRPGRCECRATIFPDVLPTHEYAAPAPVVWRVRPVRTRVPDCAALAPVLHRGRAFVWSCPSAGSQTDPAPATATCRADVRIWQPVHPRFCQLHAMLRYWCAHVQGVCWRRVPWHPSSARRRHAARRRRSMTIRCYGFPSIDHIAATTLHPADPSIPAGDADTAAPARHTAHRDDRSSRRDRFRACANRACL